MMRLTIQSIELGTANAMVHAHHRHSRPVVGHLWSLGAFGPDWVLHGAAIAALRAAAEARLAAIASPAAKEARR